MEAMLPVLRGSTATATAHWDLVRRCGRCLAGNGCTGERETHIIFIEIGVWFAVPVKIECDVSSGCGARGVCWGRGGLSNSVERYRVVSGHWPGNMRI